MSFNLGPTSTFISAVPVKIIPASDFVTLQALKLILIPKHFQQKNFFIILSDCIKSSAAPQITGSDGVS